MDGVFVYDRWLCPSLLVLQLFMMKDLVVSYHCLCVFMAGVFAYDRSGLGFLVIVQ